MDREPGDPCVVETQLDILFPQQIFGEVAPPDTQVALQYVLGGTGLVTMVVGIGCAVVYRLDSPSNERPTASSQM